MFDRLVVVGLPLVPKALVGRVGRRYVAGPTRSDALDTIRDLNAEGAMATCDVLGEEVTERSKAESAVTEYHDMLAAITEEGLDANISIKPTLLGLRIDEEYCRENVDRVVSRAKELDVFVRLDMEDHTCTDATLRLYRAMLELHGNVGIVLQAYLRRTPSDIQDLLPLNPNVRICKGIYREPRRVSWHGFETVRDAFGYEVDTLLEAGSYVGIATHDEHLVWLAMRTIDRLKLARERYEFQMLLGVDPELRSIILDAGHRLRVYVPYGPDWYPYSTRRLRENPTIARHVIRAMLKMKPKSGR